MKIFLYIIIIISFLKLSFIVATETTNLQANNSDEGLIYADIINESIRLYEQDSLKNGKIKLIVISDTKDDHLENRFKIYKEFSKFIISFFKGFDLKVPQEDTLINFWKVNSTAFMFSDFNIKIPIKLKYVFIPKTDGNWKSFYKEYPGSLGIITFSRIGFNKEKTQAFIYFGNMLGHTEGKGYYMLYEKIGGTWKQISHFMAWIS